MTKKAICIFAEGFEEIEAVTAVDLVRRAGIDVAALGVSGIDITGSHDITIITDGTLDDIDEEYDAVIVPGGIPGVNNIAESAEAMNLIKDMFKKGKLVAAICAAPAAVLGKTGILEGKKVTCAPGFSEKLPEGTVFSEDRVVADSNIITSRGAGTAGEFAFAVIEYLTGREAADKVKKATLYR